LDSVAAGKRVAALFADAATSTNNVDLYAVIADSAHALLLVGKTSLDADEFPSLTPECPQVHLFEREIAEQYGVRPNGHPWFKPASSSLATFASSATASRSCTWRSRLAISTVARSEPKSADQTSGRST